MLKAATGRNLYATVEERAEEVNSSTSTVYHHLQQLGTVSKPSKKVPYELGEKNQRERVDI